MSAKSAFGNLKESLYQSEYIKSKKKYSIYCRNKHFDNKNLFMRTYLNKIQNNKTNLVVGQYTKSDLKDICVITLGHPPSTYCVPDSETPCCIHNVPINTSSTTPFYLAQTIDPLGELFGSTPCGELNYVKYMVPNLDV